MADILALIVKIGHSFVGLAAHYIFKIIFIIIIIGVIAALLDRIVDEMKDKKDKDNRSKHNRR